MGLGPWNEKHFLLTFSYFLWTDSVENENAFWKSGICGIFLIQLKKKKKTAYTTILLIQLQITVLKLERKEYTLTQCTPLLKTETVTELTSRFLLFIDKAQRQLQQAWRHETNADNEEKSFSMD